MKLLVMGDLHYPAIDESIPGLMEARSAFYRRFISRFLQHDAFAHISLGDLTNFGFPLEYETIYSLIQEKDRNFIHVLGNHDVYAQPKSKILQMTNQKSYHAITTDDAVLIFLDTAREMDYDNWGGWIDEEQLHWFEEQVVASGKKPMIVFAHHPVYDTTERSHMKNLSIDPSIDMWNILRQKQGIGVYMNGHNHTDSIVQQENWTFVQLAACLDVHSFRQVEVDESGIQISAIDVKDDYVVKTAPFIGNAMKHFSPIPDVKREQSERECSVEFPLLVEEV